MPGQTAANFRARPRGAGAQYQARLEGCNDARTGVPPGVPGGAMCVQRFDDPRFCNSRYLSHFAAFFIDAGTKRSVVESFCTISVASLRRHRYRSEFTRSPAGARRPRPAGQGPRPAKATCLGHARGVGAGGGAADLFRNDPSAGSPTETLLRLLLPLNDRV